MKQICVISGKGGTGKTSITASLAFLMKQKIICDCDVDADDLHLILKPTILQQEDFYGLPLPEIDTEICIHCGKCWEVCQFKAIDIDLKIDEISCERCGICAHFCPQEAITMKKVKSGEWYISRTRRGTMVHARLGIAQENSGLLVNIVRKQASILASKRRLKYILIDGPPGIGCPVISSLSGVDLSLIVTEPTLSGLHDLKRVADLSFQLRTKPVVCVNKFDINEDITKKIEDYCTENNISVLEKIPFDPLFVTAMVEGKAIVEKFPESIISQKIKTLWEKIENMLKK